ncbi:protein glass-like [Musca domestica]|uniref:Protein glass-like n=1 Tax=Musca domestica TaxID=7370 RepID=A0A9J7DI67_MUSDO|nr:protein glass-like [Musca domestica]
MFAEEDNLKCELKNERIESPDLLIVKHEVDLEKDEVYPVRYPQASTSAAAGKISLPNRQAYENIEESEIYDITDDDEEDFAGNNNDDDDDDFDIMYYPNNSKRKSSSSRSSSLAGAAGSSAKKTKNSTRDSGSSKPFACPNCPKSYTMRCNLNRHLRVECNREPKFSCRICQTKYYYRCSLVQHAKSAHDLDLRNEKD